MVAVTGSTDRIRALNASPLASVICTDAPTNDAMCGVRCLIIYTLLLRLIIQREHCTAACDASFYISTCAMLVVMIVTIL